MRLLPSRAPRSLAHRIAADDVRRPLWRHPASIAAAALALTLGAVPFLPDAPEADRDRIAPAADATAAPDAPGRGRVTPAMQAEIDRVVAAGATLDRASGRQAQALA